MVKQQLLDILRCPNCVRETEGLLDYVKESWLVCHDCNRKYPIVDEIPVMLIDEGDKWADTDKAKLPVPPPAVCTLAIQSLHARIVSRNRLSSGR